MGHYVALIALDAEHSGKEIVIHISERESGYGSEIKYICLTSVAQHGFKILEENAVHLVFSIIMMICAIVSLVTWFIVGGKNALIPKETYRSLLWTSLCAASVGVWFFTEAYVWAISTGSFAASGILTYVALSLMPVSLLGILYSICSKKLVSLNWILNITKAFLLTEWILFLTGLVDFSGMLLMIHIECVVAASVFAIYLAWKKELFFVGGAIRYGMWTVSAMLLITVISYFLRGNWLLWALATAFILLSSVMLHTYLQISRAIKDITQTKQYKEYALTDIMTGLKSRYAYTIFEAQQKMGPVSKDLHLIFLDIDMLKKVNDTLGHAAGDEMIIAVSKCLKDAFGDDAECFRMGGDEFLIATSEKTDIVQKNIARFNNLVSKWSGKYVDSFTVSYGAVSANDHPDLNFEELLKTADHMMYQCKRQKAGRSESTNIQ
jgi:diguanylate cyclase (GGDEF)-like protein